MKNLGRSKIKIKNASCIQLFQSNFPLVATTHDATNRIALVTTSRQGLRALDKLCSIPAPTRLAPPFTRGEITAVSANALHKGSSCGEG